MVFPLTLIVDKNFKSFRGSCLLCENVLCQFVLKTVLGDSLWTHQINNTQVYTSILVLVGQSIFGEVGRNVNPVKKKKLPEDEVATLINMSP